MDFLTRLEDFSATKQNLKYRFELFKTFEERESQYASNRFRVVYLRSLGYQRSCLNRIAVRAIRREY